MLELPGYQIIREIGRGGMARVYLALHEGLDREVAIKVMFPNLASDDSYSERFIREARIVAKLSHHNIVTVYDVGVHDNHHYIAMEFLPGVTLDDKIKDGLQGPEIMHLLKQISAGLAYAHDKGFIHRDIKPENILFREDGTAVLSDFGIARATKSETKMTAVGTVIGTAHYMSPEQAQGKELTPSSDIYSIGIMMYEMFAGEVPYDADSTIAIVFKHIDADIPSLPAGNEKYQPILEKLMAKLPENRYQSCTDIISDINEIEQGKAPSRATEMFSTADLGLDKQSSKKTQFVQMPKTASKKPWGMIAAILITTGALGAVGYGYVTYYLPQQELAEAQKRQEEEKREQEKLANEQRLKEEQLKYQQKLEEERKIREKQLAELQALSRKQKQEADRKLAEAQKKAAEEARRQLEQQLAAQKKAEQEQLLQAQREQRQRELEQALREDQQARTNQINELLAKGQQNMAKQDLQNAYQNYKQVLTIDANNQKAKAGIKAVADRYIAQTKTHADNYQFTNATTSLRQAIDIMPEHENINSTQTYILAKKKTQREELLAKQQQELLSKSLQAETKVEPPKVEEEAPRRRSFGGF